MLRYPSSVNSPLSRMGRWGGEELGYASDLDLLYVYDVPEGGDPVGAREQALKLANLLGAALGGVRPEGIAYRVDAGLRPEGRAGPLDPDARLVPRLLGALGGAVGAPGAHQGTSRGG